MFRAEHLQKNTVPAPLVHLPYIYNFVGGISIIESNGQHFSCCQSPSQGDCPGHLIHRVISPFIQKGKVPLFKVSGIRNPQIGGRYTSLRVTVLIQKLFREKVQTVIRGMEPTTPTLDHPDICQCDGQARALLCLGTLPEHPYLHVCDLECLRELLWVCHTAFKLLSGIKVQKKVPVVTVISRPDLNFAFLSASPECLHVALPGLWRYNRGESQRANLCQRLNSKKGAAASDQ